MMQNRYAQISHRTPDIPVRALQAVLAVVVGSMLLALSARVAIPFWPVPLNMQTFVVVCLGLAYGPNLALATVLAYIMEGLAGLPVFAHGGGPAYLAGPTGGYLIGFMFAAYAAGWCARRGWVNHFVGAIGAGVLAHASVYLVGVAWLAIVLNDGQKALALGLLPFLLGDAVKTLAAGAVGWAFARWRR